MKRAEKSQKSRVVATALIHVGTDMVTYRCRNGLKDVAKDGRAPRSAYVPCMDPIRMDLFRLPFAPSWLCSRSVRAVHGKHHYERARAWGPVMPDSLATNGIGVREEGREVSSGIDLYIEHERCMIVRAGGLMCSWRSCGIAPVQEYSLH